MAATFLCYSISERENKCVASLCEEPSHVREVNNTTTIRSLELGPTFPSQNKMTSFYFLYLEISLYYCDRASEMRLYF